MGYLTAMHDRIVLQKVEAGEKNDGGIIIPDTGQEKSNLFKVVHVGPGRYREHISNTSSGFTHYDRIPMDAKEGDLVYVPKALVREIRVDNQIFYITREVELEAIYHQ